MADFTLDADLAEISDADPAAAKPDLAAELEKLRESLKSREDELVRVRKEREEAEDRAYKTSVENTDAARYVTTLEHTTLAHAKARLEADKAILRGEIAKATEMADGARVAELTEKIAELTADLKEVNHGLADAEVKAKRVAEYKAPPPPKREASVDPFESEQFRNLPQATQDYLKQHKDRGYWGANGPNAKVMSAYYAAQAEGLRDDSNAFYEHMDRVLGHSGQDEDGEGDAPAVSEPARKTAVKQRVAAAPVSRGTSDNGTGKPGKGFRLKGEYVATAERLGMTPDEYVKYAHEATQTGTTQQRADALAFYQRIRA